MKLFLDIFFLKIPSYGLMIVLGVAAANVLALLMKKRLGLDGDSILLLECCAALGGMIGAKLLYLLVSFHTIDWSRILEPDYLSQVMAGGFVFYGGLIGGLIALWLGGRILKIPVRPYVQGLLFLLPLVHGFGRIGCFLAGCCYGVPYDGPGAVVFPAGSLAPSGIPLFPVQLAEAAGLFLLSCLLGVLTWKGRRALVLPLYLLLYGILRFALEFFRYDAARGMLWGLATSQWISLLLIAAGIVLLVRRQLRADHCNHPSGAA